MLLLVSAGLNCFAVDGIPTEACYNPNSPTLQSGQQPTTLAGALATLSAQDLANGGAIDPYTGQKVIFLSILILNAL